MPSSPLRTVSGSESLPKAWRPSNSVRCWLRRIGRQARKASVSAKRWGPLAPANSCAKATSRHARRLVRKGRHSMVAAARSARVPVDENRKPIRIAHRWCRSRLAGSAGSGRQATPAAIREELLASTSRLPEKKKGRREAADPDARSLTSCQVRAGSSAQPAVPSACSAIQSIAPRATRPIFHGAT